MIRRWSIGLLVIALVVGIAWAAMAPVHVPSREKAFEIPKGTWARRMAGAKTDILPDTIRLTLKLQDILVLNNQDDVPQIFGPTLMMPGQSLRLPFASVSEYQFACTAHVSGQMTIIVDPYPASPPARLVWRARQAMESIHRMTRKA